MSETKAHKIKAELLAIQQASSDGLLRAEEVVSWARKNKSSSLHSQFEWDNGRAAAQWRLLQARNIIKINIVSEGGEPQIVSLTIDRARKGGGYRAISDVAKNRDLSAIMLQDALHELQRIQARFGRVKQLTRVWNEVDKVVVKHSAKAKQGRKLAA
jgi:hypothetical protein